jgi:hypothetical protein
MEKPGPGTHLSDEIWREILEYTYNKDSVVDFSKITHHFDLFSKKPRVYACQIRSIQDYAKGTITIGLIADGVFVIRKRVICNKTNGELRAIIGPTKGRDTRVGKLHFVETRALLSALGRPIYQHARQLVFEYVPSTKGPGFRLGINQYCQEGSCQQCERDRLKEENLAWVDS